MITYTFDDAGNLTRAVTSSELCTLAGFNTGCRETKSEVTYTYEQGRLASSKGTSSEDQRGTNTTLEYDAAGRLIKLARWYTGPSAGKPTTYAFRYDSKGELKSRTMDGNGDGKPETEDTIVIRRDASGRLTQLSVERTKPRIDLKKGAELGVVTKTTKFSYDAAGLISGAETKAKVVELDFSKPTAQGSYGRKVVEHTQSTAYRTNSAGLIESLRSCRDPQDNLSCVTSTLTYAEAGEKRITGTPLEYTTEEFYGECHIEVLPPTQAYLAPLPTTWTNMAGVSDSLVPTPDDYLFRLVHGKRGGAK